MCVIQKIIIISLLLKNKKNVTRFQGLYKNASHASFSYNSFPLSYPIERVSDFFFFILKMSHFLYISSNASHTIIFQGGPLLTTCNANDITSLSEAFSESLAGFLRNRFTFLCVIFIKKKIILI